MQHADESTAHRIARRRARRWARRARIFAPLLALPGMLGVLLLSVNLIESRPDESRRAAADDRPATASAPAVPAAHAARESAHGNRIEREPFEAAQALPVGETSAPSRESD